MDSPPLIRRTLDSTELAESFEQACDRLTRWIVACMAEWFGPDWARPIFPTKFDGVAGLAAREDEPQVCEVGDGYFLGQAGSQVMIDKGKTYWMDRGERTEGAIFFRIAECTLRCGAFPPSDDGLHLFRICVAPLPGCRVDQPGVSIMGYWNLPPAAHATALKAWNAMARG